MKKNIQSIHFELKENEDHIPLNLLLKALRLVETGGEANLHIDNGEVKVNGKVETRRRNKLRTGDVIEFDGNKVIIGPNPH
jgi:ribosome-associated protein